MSDDTRRESLEGDASRAADDDSSTTPGEQERATSEPPARRDGRPGPDVERAVVRPPETR